MARTLYIQIEGGTEISDYLVDSVDTDYKPEGSGPAQRRIAGIKGGDAIPNSIQLVSALVGWWLIDDELIADKFLRVQAPGNPRILKLGCEDILIEKSYANGGGDLVRAVTDKPVAEFNTIFILGWWSDLRKKVLRVQAPGNPTVLRIPADKVESTTGEPLQQRVRASNNDGKVIADFDIPQLLAWWVEDENAPEEAGLKGKHLFVEVNDDPAPYLTISVDDAKVGTETDPRERNVVGLDKDGKVIASFNIASIYRYWFDFPPKPGPSV